MENPKHPDLFGGESEIHAPEPNQGPYQIFRDKNNYRLSGNRTERCATCINLIDGRYFKCKLQGTSHSETSDIRKKNVCDLWEGIK